jgi:uncharacterized protein YwgA
MKDFDELKLARVIDACGGIDGRVKMQKIVYLLGAMGYDLPFHDFVIRQHGPFSRSVAWATDALKSAEILLEVREDRGEGADGTPVYQYSYTVRDEIAPLIRKEFEVLGPDKKPRIDEIAKRLRREERAVLEVAATRVFLQREESLPKAKLDEELNRLKGHLAEHFPRADKLLSELTRDGFL